MNIVTVDDSGIQSLVCMLVCVVSDGTERCDGSEGTDLQAKERNIIKIQPDRSE